MERIRLQKGDALAVALVVALAVGMGLWLASRAAETDHCVATIYQDGQVVRTVELDAVTEAERFCVDGAFHNEITVEPGRICISSADCPGADCVHSGWISQPGRSVVCLPNRVEIRIRGGSSDVDGVAR